MAWGKVAGDNSGKRPWGSPMVSKGEGKAADPLLEGSVLSTCPFCACGCGLYLHLDRSHLVGVSSSQNHPASQGRLCARGWAAHEAPLWGPRLLRPAIRESENLRPVPWTEAIRQATRELNGLLSAGKRIGVLVSGRCTNEESYLGAKLARGALHTGNLAGSLTLQYETILRGLGIRKDITDTGGSLKEVEESDRILLLEGDLCVTHPRAAFAVLRALRRGAKLVTLGLARTSLSRLATAHFSLNPVTPQLFPPDLPAALGLTGDGGLRTSVLLAPFSPSPEALFATVHALAEALDSATRGNGSTIRFFPLPQQANTRGAYDMGASPGHLPGRGPLDDPSLRSRLREVWGTDPCLDEGIQAEAMAGQVDGLVVLRDHLSGGFLSSGAASGALRSLESLIVLDSFRSPTSDAATVALPLAAFSETDGTLTSWEGRVQRFRAAAPLPGEGRPGWAVLSDLLNGLGVPCDYSSFAEVFAEIRRVVPEYGALPEGVLEASWGGVVSPARAPSGDHSEGGRGSEPTSGDAPAGTHWLALEGAFDWAEDPSVEGSPTLRRDGAARRKLNPGGVVTMSPADGQALGIRAGWSVRLRSRHGEAQLPVALNPRVEDGILLVPYLYREALTAVLGDGAVERVEVERT
ncbi:MAG: hypothetical protein E4G90_08615 [Gemmatimonadales bacterium]|nr:MAG: hypothetical protein E4G90_08615 [Gemmatimonadales bacterium]